MFYLKVIPFEKSQIPRKFGSWGAFFLDKHYSMSPNLLCHFSSVFSTQIKR